MPGASSLELRTRPPEKEASRDCQKTTALIPQYSDLHCKDGYQGKSLLRGAGLGLGWEARAVRGAGLLIASASG